MGSLIREANGNVVLTTSGNVPGSMQLRFFQQFGAAPAEIWQYGAAGPITNSFAGSGVSLNFETGQDPTQASANGFTPHPVSRIDLSGDRFYFRETLFDPLSGSYGVEGYIPDFWLSGETIDDYIPEANSGWRTRYTPGNFAARLQGLDCPVIFDGTSGTQSGIFVVGNEMTANTIRIYKDGWIAFKTTVAATNVNSTALVGFMFQKTRGASASPTKDDLYFLPGLHLIFNMQGGWALSSQGIDIAAGALSAPQLTKLIGAGLPVEVRTHPGMVGYLEIYFDGILSKVIPDTGFVADEETWFGLFAQASAGYVTFGYRQLFDLNAKISCYYFALPNNKILFHQNIISNDLKFYRANMPGVFLNASLFPQKSCGVIKHDGTYEEKEGVFDIFAYRSLWAGNITGTLGVLATVKKVDIDGAAGINAHALLQKVVVNNEFVMMLNPFSVNWNSSPQTVRHVSMLTEFSTKRV